MLASTPPAGRQGGGHQRGAQPASPHPGRGSGTTPTPGAATRRLLEDLTAQLDAALLFCYKVWATGLPQGIPPPLRVFSLEILVAFE